MNFSYASGKNFLISYKNQLTSSLEPKNIPLKIKPKHFLGNFMPYNKARVLPQEPPKRYHSSIFKSDLRHSMSDKSASVLLQSVSA